MQLSLANCLLGPHNYIKINKINFILRGLQLTVLQLTNLWPLEFRLNTNLEVLVGFTIHVWQLNKDKILPFSSK